MEKQLVKWMIWGYPYFGNTHIPFKGNFEDDFPIPMVGYVIM